MYKDEEIRTIVKNVANDNEGFKLIDLLLDKLGAFERGVNLQNTEMDIYNRGRREVGLWLLDTLRDSNFNKFIEIQKKRSREQCQKTNKLSEE